MQIHGFNSSDSINNLELRLKLNGQIPMNPETDEAQPEVKEGLTFVGKLDRDLSRGLVPGDLTYSLGQDDFESDRLSYRREIQADMPLFTIGGYLAGMSFAEAPALAALAAGSHLALGFICGGIGLAVGAVVSWLRNREKYTGTVTVTMDGKKTAAPYYMYPEHYKKSPGMLRARMTAQGVLGEKILPHTFKKGDIPSKADPERLQELNGYAGELVTLGKERRLVASFGKKSRYGKDALQLIDSPMARDLMAGGKTVYVVNGRKTTHIPHHYAAELLKGRNTEHIEAMTEVHDYQETRFDYSLTPLNKPADLAGVEKGTGIPEGMMGVYAGEGSYSEVVFRDRQRGYAKIDLGPRTSSEVENYSHTRESRVEKPSIETSGNAELRFVRTANVPFLVGMMGAIAGGVTALSAGLMGLPVAALMATGFVTGRFIGRKIA